MRNEMEADIKRCIDRSIERNEVVHWEVDGNPIAAVLAVREVFDGEFDYGTISYEDTTLLLDVWACDRPNGLDSAWRLIITSKEGEEDAK